MSYNILLCVNVALGESMNDFTGFVVMLSSLWTCSGADAQETRSVILTVIIL